MSDYTPVIGLEIHVELNTKSKMFCQCKADYFGKEPNSQTCPVCLGFPGALPVPNRKAVEYCQLIGLALSCKLSKTSKFDRKHYFYPDLPKGYQISQYGEPLAVDGKVSTYNPITKKERIHQITRVHMEEDTGKLLHRGDESLVDFNRSGVPLVEIVTEPDFDNSEEVNAFLKELQSIVRELGVSDADMEKGSMRLEPNISLRSGKDKKLPMYKVEIKNINSFNFVRKAIEYEIRRQTEILKQGNTPDQETRGFNEDKGITFSQRAKEYAHDYRYFPEPDIPPMEFETSYLEEIRKKLPELPSERFHRYVETGLTQEEAFLITYNQDSTEKFEKLSKSYDPREIAKVIINRKNISIDEIERTLKSRQTPMKTDENKLNTAIEQVVHKQEKAVLDYKSGKETVLMFLVGQVMSVMKGRADAQIVRKKLMERLK